MPSAIDRLDGVNEGLAKKAPCRVATTANITLSGLQTIDGITLVADDRVLVKNQATASQNGIYNASSGAWSRAKDFDGNRDIVKGTQVTVTDGTVNTLREFFVTSANPITIDSSSISFSAIDDIEAVNVDTIADLRARVAGQGRKTALVFGYATPGDEGGGFFRWDATSTAADDGALVIRTTDVSASDPGRYLRVVDDVLTAQMFGILPDTVDDVTSKLQALFTAGAGKKVRLPEGTIRQDGQVTLPSSITIEMHPGTIIDGSNAPSLTTFWSAQGSLGAQLPLTQNGVKLNPAELWLPSTATLTRSHVVGDQVSFLGINFRCIQNHNHALGSSYDSATLAFYADDQAGYWERSNIRTAGDISDYAVDDIFILQHSKIFDAQSWLNVEGEIQRVRETGSGIIYTKEDFFNDYDVATYAAFIQKIIPVSKIKITGGAFLGRTDLANGNGSIALYFNCAQDIDVQNVKFTNFFSNISLRNVIRYDVSYCRHEHGQGLAYGLALSDYCHDGNIHHNHFYDMRHALTTSAEAGRMGPRHVNFDDNFVDSSRRYTASAASPYGGSGDAIDTHPGCDYVYYRRNTVINASGSGIHCECPNMVVEDNVIRGCDYGMTLTNNSRPTGSVSCTRNKVYQAKTRGISIVYASQAASGNFAYIRCDDNEVDGCGSHAYYVVGTPASRLKNVSFTGNKGRASYAGVYLAYLQYVDAPVIIGNEMESTVASQKGIAILNYVNGVVTGNSVRQPASATGTAFFFSNTDCSAVASGSNVGTGTITMDSEEPLLTGVQEGVYLVRCTTTATNGGTFTVYDIDGTTILGMVSVGGTWSTFIQFVINDGATDYSLGDGFNITVAGSTVSTAKSASNIGGYTITVPLATVIADSATEGAYTITCNNIAIVGSETWTVKNPSGSVIGTATTGVLFNTTITFTINAVGTAAVLGDGFTYTGRIASRGMQISANTLYSPSTVSAVGCFWGNTTKSNVFGFNNDFSQATTQLTVGTGSGHEVRVKDACTTVATNAAFTLTPITSTPNQIHTGVLTGNRTITLSTTNVWDGARFRITRTGSGSFNLAVGALINLRQNQWCEIVYSATAVAWTLVEAGLLSLSTSSGAALTTGDIGVSVQAWDTDLDQFAGLSWTAADKFAYSTASHTLALGDISGAARTVLDDASIAAMRVTMEIDKRTTPGDADYTILATDKVIALNAALTATRTWTLPAASAVNGGKVIYVVDEAGGITSANTLTIARAGADTISGGTSAILTRAYSRATLESDGISKWTVIGFSNAVSFTFTGSGTFTTPIGMRLARVDIGGAGGQGGSGRRGAAGAARSGGTGGWGSIIVTRVFDASELGSSQTVTIGAGGTGAGGAQTVDTTSGIDGAAGGSSTFGALLKAIGGYGGIGGTAAATAATPASGSLIAGLVTPTSSSVTLSLPANILVSTSYAPQGGSIGGCGGSISSGNADLTAGNGGLPYADPAFSTGGAAGGVGTGGSNGSNSLLLGFAGTGGGGGGGNSGGVGGTGGIGGRCSGGGGGGASVNGSNSGAGGVGGDGYCVVTCYA